MLFLNIVLYIDSKQQSIPVLHSDRYIYISKMKTSKGFSPYLYD